MDSFEFNKVAGAVLLVAATTLGLNIFADKLLFASAKPEKPGFEVAVAGGDHGAAAAAKGVPAKPIAELLASADAAKGQNLTKQCASCHSFDKGGAAKTGPNLYNVVNRPRGSVAGFNYSAGMKAAGENWDYEHLNKFLESPKGAVAGTSMTFAGIKNEEQRADVIAYLRSLSDSPAPLPGK